MPARAWMHRLFVLRERTERCRQWQYGHAERQRPRSRAFGRRWSPAEATC